MSAPQFSVVLATSGSSSSTDAVIAALERGCEGVATELIVVRAGTLDVGEPLRARFAEIHVERHPPGTLTPVLWGIGLQRARGEIVAFTTDQLRVSPAWARTLRDSISAGAVGAAGPIDLGPDTDAATTAAYYLRFSVFAPQVWPKAAPARDIPGDNAAYRRDAVMRHADLLREGFWEVEFHRRFEREGLTLQMVPSAGATLMGPVPFGPMLRQRFRHGEEFASSRVQRHGESRAKLLFLAPLVPFVLLARIGRRALAMPRNRGRFLSALPQLSALAVSWAAGEAAGALRAGVRSEG